MKSNKDEIHIAIYIKKELVYRSTDPFATYNRLFKQNIIALDLNEKMVRLSKYLPRENQIPDLEHRFHITMNKIKSMDGKPTMGIITIIPGIFIVISNEQLRKDWYPNHLLSIYPVSIVNLTTAHEYINKILNYTKEIEAAMTHINDTMDKRLLDDIAGVFVMINIFTKTHGDWETFRIYKDTQVIKKYITTCKNIYHTLIPTSIKLLAKYIETHVKDPGDRSTLNLIKNLIEYGIITKEELIISQILLDNSSLYLKPSATRCISHIYQTSSWRF